MQTSSNFIRGSALTAVLGGLLWDAKMIYESSSDRQYPNDLTDTLLFVVPLLLLVGLADLYLHCRGGWASWRIFPWQASSWGLSG